MLSISSGIYQDGAINVDLLEHKINIVQGKWFKLKQEMRTKKN